jgi:hypothetical protein
VTNRCYRPKVLLDGTAIWSREGLDLGDADERHVLPVALYDKLTRGVDRGNWTYFESPELAVDALLRVLEDL